MLFGDDIDPPDDALVVRFGSTGKSFLQKALEQAAGQQDRTGTASLSVWCATPEAGETRTATVARACRAARVAYRLIRVATAAEVRRQGFALSRDAGEPPFHYNIALSTVSIEEIERLLEAFGDEEENPACRR